MRVPGFGSPEKLQRARSEAQLALGTHDFAAFRTSIDARTDTVRTLHALRIEQDTGDERLFHLHVVGTAFLHNMVRILVGTLVDVALGRLQAGAIARALASRQRRDAGLTAPASGLCLERVYLPREGESRWP